MLLTWQPASCTVDALDVCQISACEKMSTALSASLKLWEPATKTERPQHKIRQRKIRVDSRLQRSREHEQQPKVCIGYFPLAQDSLSYLTGGCQHDAGTIIPLYIQK